MLDLTFLLCKHFIKQTILKSCHGYSILLTSIWLEYIASPLGKAKWHSRCLRALRKWLAGVGRCFSEINVSEYLKLLTGPLGQAMRDGRCLRALNECHSSARSTKFNSFQKLAKDISDKILTPPPIDTAIFFVAGHKFIIEELNYTLILIYIFDQKNYLKHYFLEFSHKKLKSKYFSGFI